MKHAPSSSRPSRTLSQRFTRDPQGGAEPGGRLRGRRNRPNDRDSTWRIIFSVVASKIVNKRPGIPALLRNQLTAIAPKKNKTTVIAPSTLKLLKKKTSVVTPSTVRAQLPAIRMTLGAFGLFGNRRVGSKKNTERKTPRIQKAFSVSSAGIG